jgi:plasmid segregation protein ParM
MKILGVDAGNYNVKTVSDQKADRFYSNIISYFDRTLQSSFGEDDMVVEHEGKKYYAGSIAKFEDKFESGTLGGETKNHEEARLRTLIGIYRQVNDGDEVSIVVGQPISRHTDTEKEAIIAKLVGTHELTINGKTKVFEVVACRVAPEGGAAYWCDPQEGRIRVLDIGSSTINYATLVDGKYIAAKSGTLPFGMESEDATNEEIAEAINRKLSRKWAKRDIVLLVGGGAERLHEHLKQYFPFAKVLRPIVNNGEEGGILDPYFANAVGFYRMAKKVFEKK